MQVRRHTLVHLRRLASPPTSASRRRFTGFAKWRGWGEDASRLRGRVGGAPSPRSTRLRLCRAASGPLVYMAGAMMCVSAPPPPPPLRPLLLRLPPRAERRNDGLALRLLACTPSPPPRGNEDAGIGFNVFRSVLRFRTAKSSPPCPATSTTRSRSGGTLLDDRVIFVHGGGEPLRGGRGAVEHGRRTRRGDAPCGPASSGGGRRRGWGGRLPPPPLSRLQVAVGEAVTAG